MMKDVAVEIEHEDIVRLHRRFVGATAGAEQYPIGARHAHGHMPEHPDRALQVEHSRQGRGLAAQRGFVVHETPRPVPAAPENVVVTINGVMALTNRAWRHDRQALRKATSCGEAMTVAGGLAAGSLRCMKPCSASG